MNKYKVALKEEVNKTVFEVLYAEWSNEDATAIFPWGDRGHLGAIDLLNLNSVVLNRRELKKLKEYEAIKNKVITLKKKNKYY
ncbi:MAG: hypothetical protein NTV61_10435 [Candidatus Bathyarchaeota archaeon]|nr:hypothetical protein [Candidatus Bathyarchaeota archaeon]